MNDNTSSNSQTTQSEMKGVILTIENSGKVKSQIIGTLNEAEFLGLGVYLTNVLMKDGIIALSQNQMATAKTLQQFISDIQRKKEEEKCGKECCSDCLPLSDSGSSSESCQVSSDE